MSYHNRNTVISAKIRTLFYSLGASTYDEVAPKIEYWIECALTEQFTTVDKLVEEISDIAWACQDFHPGSQFLREFRDAPHRSEKAKSFVDELCARVFWWFVAISTENLSMDWNWGAVAMRGGRGFIIGASFVGYLIERGLLNNELVRRHLVKSLTAHHYVSRGKNEEIVRANAIYRLFSVAGNTLLQGLLDPEDVQVCFETLDAQNLRPAIEGLDAARLEVRCATPPGAHHWNLLTCGPGTSRAPCHVVAAERRERTKGRRGDGRT